MWSCTPEGSRAADCERYRTADLIGETQSGYDFIRRLYDKLINKNIRDVTGFFGL